MMGSAEPAVATPGLPPAAAQRRDLRDRAALLLWEDRLTDEAIARSLGICRRTLAYWKRRPEVTARIVALGEAYRARP